MKMLFAVIMATLLLTALCSCSSSRVIVKDCEHLGNRVYQCKRI